MGHKLSTTGSGGGGGDNSHHHRHHHHHGGGGHRHHYLLKQRSSSAAADETTDPDKSQATYGRDPIAAAAAPGAPATHSNGSLPYSNGGRNSSAGASGLLAAIRWKSLTRRRRSGRRFASSATAAAAAAGATADAGTAASGKNLLNHVNNSSFVAAATVEGQIPAAGQAGNGGTGVWAKLISHLSRKMAPGRRRGGGGRRSSTAAAAAAAVNGNGTLDHLESQLGAPTAGGRPSAGARCLHGGTSSVLPVTRHPITSVIAYGDDSLVPAASVQGTGSATIKDPLDVNSNVADIVRRITISTRCSVGRRDVIDFDVPTQPVTSRISHIISTTYKNAADNQQPPKAAPRRTIQIQASTGELLAGLGEFLRCRCRRLRHFDGSEVVTWLRSVDRTLIEHAWQDTPFVGPANLVLVYLLTCDAVDPDVITVGELQAIVMACLYVAFSYAGSEISYPLKPFITSAGVDEVTSSSGGPGKKRFWNRCLAIIERSSTDMLRLNREPSYFAELFRELKTYASSTPAYCSSAIAPTVNVQDVSSTINPPAAACRVTSSTHQLPDANVALTRSTNRCQAAAGKD